MRDALLLQVGQADEQLRRDMGSRGCKGVRRTEAERGEVAPAVCIRLTGRASLNEKRSRATHFGHMHNTNKLGETRVPVARKKGRP